MPELASCVVCRATVGWGRVWWSLVRGGVLCKACRLEEEAERDEYYADLEKEENPDG